jgi:hypothetical protein
MDKKIQKKENMFSNVFKAKVELTEYEESYKLVIEKMCDNPETHILINPSNGDYILSNKAKHFDIIIDSQGVTITNTNFSSRRQLPENILDLFKNIAKIRATADRERIVKDILSREKALLEQIMNGK